MSTSDPAATILLVEDDAPTRTFLADNLTADGYELLVADCARDGLRLLETKFPDLALVDLGLPDGSGLDIVRRVRASDGVASRIDPAVPLVVLSGRAGELDRLRGFDRGCDDYVCKPFSYPELRARVEALLRRADVRRRPGRLRVGELEVDAAARVVRLRGTPVELSQKEFALVRTLASDPTRVFTKDELLRTIWGFRTLGSTRTLDSHACRLRHKLGRGGDRFVVNVWGVGYRLVDGPSVRARAAPEPAPALAPAAAVAALPVLAVGRPLDAALLAPWLLAVRRRRARCLLAPAAAPRARAGRARLPRAARPADRGAPRAARRRAPRRAAARAGGRGRARARSGRGRARGSRGRAPRAPRARPRRARRRRRPARLPGADLAHGRGGLRLPGRARRAALGRDRARRPRAPDAGGRQPRGQRPRARRRARAAAGARAGRPRAHRGRRRGAGAAGAGGRPDASPTGRARAPRAGPGHRRRHRRSPRRPPGGGARPRAARASPSSSRHGATGSRP